MAKTATWRCLLTLLTFGAWNCFLRPAGSKGSRKPRWRAADRDKFSVGQRLLSRLRASSVEAEVDIFGRALPSEGDEDDDHLEARKHFVVKVFCMYSGQDPSHPWTNKQQEDRMGSGCVILHQGQRCLLTNAHVVADASYVEVRKAGNAKKFFAERLKIAHECDLALLGSDGTSTGVNENIRCYACGRASPKWTFTCSQPRCESRGGSNVCETCTPTWRCHRCNGQEGRWEIVRGYLENTGSEMTTTNERPSHRRHRANHSQWWLPPSDAVWAAQAWSWDDWEWNDWDGHAWWSPWQESGQPQRPYESACGSTDPVEAVSEYIEVQPKALKLVIGRGKENIKRWKKHYEVDITVRTNDTDGQFAGRIHEQAGLVVTGSEGAIEQIRRHVQKIQGKMNAGRFRDEPEERRFYVMMEQAFRSLTFCKADMNKSLANFASFTNRTYFEVQGLNHGRKEPSNTPRVTNITLSRDCAPLVNDFQELLPVWMEQMDGKVDTKVVVRLGRLLYFGKRDTVKGVLSEEKFKELMPGQDFATQFSRHLHPQKNVVQPMLEGLKDAGRGTMIDLTKEKRHRTELRFHLETPEGSAHFPREIDVKTVKTFREFISEGPQVPRDMDKMDISSTSSVHLVADADFVSSPVAFRVHVASDANRSDLKRQFQKAQWRILPGDGEEVGLQLSNSEVRYTLRRKSETREIWFDGYVEMIWTEAVDLFNGCQLPYDGLHLSSPALNAALKARETAKAVCEFQRLLDTAQHLVSRFSR